LGVAAFGVAALGVAALGVAAFGVAALGVAAFGVASCGVAAFGVAALGVAAFEVLRDALAAVEPALVDLPFVVTSDELNGVSLDPTGRTRPHSPRVLTLERAMAECAEAGVWLGVHWRFDGVAGRTLGLRVASEAGWYF
jgi:hypothetical protein